MYILPVVMGNQVVMASAYEALDTVFFMSLQMRQALNSTRAITCFCGIWFTTLVSEMNEGKDLQ